MGVVMKYARAVGSSNLKDDAQHHQTEVLAAAALSGVFGAKIFRVKYGNDQTSYSALLEDWKRIVESKAALRNWKPEISKAPVPKMIAERSLDYWLNDVCPACTGKKYATLSFAPNVMSDDFCPVCDGTGQKPLQAPANLIDYVRDMIEVLDSISRHAAGEMMRKLNSDMEF